MTTQNLSLFKALGGKMDYLNQRQRVISQNIANSDTPGYRPKDLTAADFSDVLKGITNKSGVAAVSMEKTSMGHMGQGGEIHGGRSKKQKETYEVAPAGNAVIMEEQLLNAGQTVNDYNLMTNLYQKHVNMMRTAIGAGQ